jgi:hypothetical protein
MADDRRTNDYRAITADTMAAFKARNQWNPVTGDNGMWQAALAEVETAVNAAVKEAYQRGAAWGLQQHQPVTVNINCPHTEVTRDGPVG